MAKLYRLSRDVELRFRDLHTVRAKAGTPVQMIPDGRGLPCYALSPGSVETDSPTGRGTLWAHDTAHYYIWAPADSVEEIAR